MSNAVKEVVTELDAHRERFEAFCRSLAPDELELAVPQSTWIVRDFISHLATIDGPVAEMFRAMHLGEDTGIRTPDGAKFDVDDWNEGQVQQRRAFSLDEIFAEAAASRAALKVTLESLTDEDLARTLKFQGDSKRGPSEVPLGGYLRGWCKHDPMHALDMSRALPHRQAELAPWFDDPIIKMYQQAMNR